MSNETLRPATLSKKRLWQQVFSCEFCEISKNTFLHRAPLVTAFGQIKKSVFTMLMYLGKTLFSNNNKLSKFASVKYFVTVNGTRILIFCQVDFFNCWSQTVRVSLYVSYLPHSSIFAEIDINKTSQNDINNTVHQNMRTYFV